VEKKSNLALHLNTVRKLYAASAFLSGVLLFFTASFFTLPLIDGWYNFPGGSKSIFPYRDYYYPVPPFTYFEAQIVSALPFPSISLRLFHILLGGFFSLSLYGLATKFSSRKNALCAAIFCCSILSSLKLEPAGGWNTQSIFLSTIGLSFYIHGWMSENQKSKFGIFAGIFFFLSAITKQTVILPIFTLIACSLVIGIKRKSHATLKLIQMTILVQIIGGIILSLYLHINSALSSFVQIMISSGGKNLIILDLLQKILAGLLENLFKYHSILIVTLVLLHFCRSYIRNKFLLKSIGMSTLILLSINIFSNLNQLNQIIVGIILSMLNVFSLKLVNKQKYLILNVVIVLIIPIILGINNFGPSEKNILTKIKMFLFLNNNIMEFWITSSILMVLFFFTQLRSDKKPSLDYEVSLLISLFVISNIIFAALSSGGSYFLFWFIPILIIGIPKLISILKQELKHIEKIAYISLMTIIIISIISFVGKTIVLPYSWWGWNEPSILHHERVRVESGYYKGVFITKQQKSLMDTVADYQIKAAQISPIKPRTLHSFPNIVMTQSLTPIANYTGLNCFIAWFDLCPNKLAIEDLEKFKQLPSSVVVWSQPTEDAFIIHEQLFLKEKSALRSWNEYRLSQVESKSWQLVGSIPASSMNWWPIEIYAVMKN
jgi:hypothetical protein